MGAWRSSWAVAALALAGCAQTTRVSDDVSAEKLLKSNKAVGLMRIGAASKACRDVGVMLGVKEGDGYRQAKTIGVANVASVTDVPVAEVELEPGQYHVIGYSCTTDKGIKTATDPGGATLATGRLYRTSYASFAVAPGEVVNLGYLLLAGTNQRGAAFGSQIKLKVEVKDWPLDEIERFKAKRPALYERMTTRLMHVDVGAQEPPAAETCARMKSLKAEGKIANLPATCA